MGQLSNCKDPFFVLVLPFPLAQIGEEAEIVLVDRNRTASLLKFALITVPVQNQWRRCAWTLVLLNKRNYLPCLLNVLVKVDIYGLVVSTVDDSAEVGYLREVA